MNTTILENYSAKYTLIAKKRTIKSDSSFCIIYLIAVLTLRQPFVIVDRPFVVSRGLFP
jgi:hypothetical protein